MHSSSVFAGSAPLCCPNSLSSLTCRSAKKLIFFFIVLCGLALFLHTTFYYQSIPPFNPLIQLDPSHKVGKILPGERKLVILLPADNSSPDLCKVISSAVALGYPAPVIVNWKTDFHTDADGIGPSQLGKISGTLEYLDWATGKDAPEGERLGKDDLVVMLDAHDVWLQLPPSVLLHRYFKANEEANRRLEHEHGYFDGGVMQQTIVVAAQKGCVAPRDSVSKMHCDAIPESTLSPNVYGLFTDSWLFRWKYTRPRYVNSGSFMGPANDMRKYFQRVKDKMDRNLRELRPGQELGGDQGIFAEVFGEQEVWRRQVREQQEKGYQAWKQFASSLVDDLEYHVGLDYAQELFYPTCYSETDSYFVALDDEAAVKKESNSRGLWTPRIGKVADDIKEEDNPLVELFNGTQKDLSWGSLPLYTDFWTASIPVFVHHNAWRKGLKSRRVTWWDKTWYFPYLRQLVEAHLQPNETSSLASLEAEGGSLTVLPYDAKRTHRAPLLFGKDVKSKDWILRPADWDAVCRDSNSTIEAEKHWYDEVFRDGKGPL